LVIQQFEAREALIRYHVHMRIILAAIFGLILFPAIAAEIRVIDGDTISVDGERIRIIGIDAPEIRRAKCDAEYRRGMAAKAHLGVLVAGGVQIRSQGRDRYRRTLAIVRDMQGRDVAAILIGEGLARAYDGRGRRQSWC